MERIENLILRSLVHNEEYSRKVIPFIEPSYFHDSSERILFEEIAQYMVEVQYSTITESSWYRG